MHPKIFLKSTLNFEFTFPFFLFWLCDLGDIGPFLCLGFVYPIDKDAVPTS